MSLFKKPILECYNLIRYTNDGFLLLHCSRNDVVRAPFDGRISITKDGCVLDNNEFQLYINHMLCDKAEEVSAGDIIGTPKVERDMAYIGLQMVRDNNTLEEVTIYLNHLDKTLSPKEIKVKGKIEAEAEKALQESIEPKPKTRKKSKKKK